MEYDAIINFFGLLIISLYACKKILNIQNISNLKIASAIVFSLITGILLSYVPFGLHEAILLLSVGVFVVIITRVKGSLLMTAVFISVGMSLGIKMLSYSLMLLLCYFLGKLYFIGNEMLGNTSLATPLLGFGSPGDYLIFIPYSVWYSILFVVNVTFITLFFKILKVG
jgi:hypothetical protein